METKINIDEREAKIIVLLNNLKPQDKNAYVIAAKTDIGYGTAYNLMRVLKEKGALDMVKSTSLRKTIFNATAEGLEEALRILEQKKE